MRLQELHMAWGNAFLVGIMFLGEHAGATRIVAAVLIVSGLVLMKSASPN